GGKLSEESPSFGETVALSPDGSTMLIGAPGDDGGRGAAWVFTRSGSTWTQQGEELTGSGESGASEFASSVALSADGDTALIGGAGDDGHTGAAWVFTRTGSTWTQQGGKLAGSGEVGPGWFGRSVALSADGDTALVGAFDDDVYQGAAWVFTRSGSTWTQQGGKLVGGGGCGTPDLGSSVALSADGDTALVGASWDCDVGAAWVFTRTGSTWTQQGEKLKGSGEVGKAFFGESVALSADGDTALMGAPQDDHDAGAAWVFTRSGATWTQQGAKLTGGGEIGEGFFGRSVALSGEGDTALIGGSYENTGSNGAAWVLARSDSTWSQQGERLDGSGESTEAEYGLGGGGFGSSVALSSDAGTALIGGGHESRLAGAAWVFAGEPASAPSPAQFGRCIRVPSVRGAHYRGRYGRVNCTTLDEKGRYEWYPGVDKTRFTSSLTSGGATFETVKRAKVACSGETGAGEYSATTLTTVAGVTLAFTGCELLGQACSSAHAAPGEIVTGPLEGVLGVTRLGETAARNGIGLALSPAGENELFTEFSCGATTVSIRGSVIGVLAANHMAVSSKLAFSAAHGTQHPEGFVGEPSEVLEASFDGGPFERIALKLKSTQTNEEAVEMSSARS
ncbi:MAG: hypothetical protein ACLPUT_09425, partial [Solirubrobacteraceae bacterium]